MDTARILITSAFLRPGDETDLALKQHGFDTVHAPLRGPRPPGELEDLLSDVSAVIAGSDRFDDRAIASAPDLRVIARTGVGYDSIDTAAASSHGVAVCNAPGVNSDAVAELALTFILMLARRVPEAMRSVREGAWARPTGIQLDGATLGIVGLGAIGRTVAHHGQTLGMNVIAHDPYADPGYAADHGIELLDLDRVLAAADFISLHIALTPETHHLIDERALRRMKKTAYLINTARGPVVDERALVAALDAGELAGAALDVVEEEPLAVSSTLRDHPRAFVTAHIGGSTSQARDESARVAVSCVVDILHGRTPRSVVNPEYLQHLVTG
ncbi:phosphoglycerate dehydrogenase [Microbacterium sp. cf332]|uniref:phosphoglycerate dehydrogenase n=1 Tax=Microbacterium sp. cf332 TaxID=1761804 RepID=UPI000884E6DB|nr:phosphoglycerate dehydrogenase [Microbacterium sp. cf332]SDQ54546.1 D-3-phosphoglycerate dehydrogenase [Microbacterium sp. cf332]